MTFRQRLTVLPRDVLWLLYTNSSLMWPFSVKRYSIILQIIYVECSTFKTIKSKWVPNFEFFWNVHTVSEIFQLSVLYDVFSSQHTWVLTQPPTPSPNQVLSHHIAITLLVSFGTCLWKCVIFSDFALLGWDCKENNKLCKQTTQWHSVLFCPPLDPVKDTGTVGLSSDWDFGMSVTYSGFSKVSLASNLIILPTYSICWYQTVTLHSFLLNWILLWFQELVQQLWMRTYKNWWN